MLKFKVIKESYEDLKYLENFIQSTKKNKYYTQKKFINNTNYFV